MIKLNRLNQEELWVNCDRIEFVEATPDTMVTFESGHKLIVLQSIQEVLELIIAYKKRIYPILRED